MFEPTVELRFIKRDGFRILQQKWVKQPDPTEFLKMVFSVERPEDFDNMTEYEWHDVPLEEEEEADLL